MDELCLLPVGPGGSPVQRRPALVLSRITDTRSGRPCTRFGGPVMGNGGPAQSLGGKELRLPQMADGLLKVPAGLLYAPLCIPPWLRCRISTRYLRVSLAQFDEPPVDVGKPLIKGSLQQ